MLLYSPLKKRINILILIVFSYTVNAQIIDSTAVYTLYRLKPIVAIDFGYNSAPFSIRSNFEDPTITKLRYRHNPKGMMGIAFAYKWFSLRLGAGVFANLRPVSLYGRSNYIDLGLQCSLKNFHGEIDFRQYYGYVLENATYSPHYNSALPNDTDFNLDVHNIGVKVTYFNNKNFKMDAFYANRGVYNKKVFTWYLLSKVDFFGVRNQQGSIIPNQLFDSTNTKTRSEHLGAVEFGVMPGFGHANRIKRFQYGVLFALGPRMQFKDYEVDGNKTTKASIVPRYDMKLMVGYNLDHFFTALHFEIDNKNIHFNQLKYNQNFLFIRLQTGWRFPDTNKEIRQAKKLAKQNT